jgi:hypothetical protein
MGWLGLPGVAVALITGTVLGGFVNFARLRRRFGVPGDRKVFARLAFAVTAMVGAAGVSAIPLTSVGPRILLSVVFGATVLALQWRILDDHERLWFRRALRLSATN